MQEERLFALATEAIALTAIFVVGDGWRVTVTSRAQGEPYSDELTARYSHLTTAELADVTCEEVCRRLGTS